ncbi:MAG: hypothetical protein GX824_04020, partial [Clostridiales bacterium]|nr:hypothetical protein [Clostridiales bacterium]
EEPEEPEEPEEINTIDESGHEQSEYEDISSSSFQDDEVKAPDGDETQAQEYISEEQEEEEADTLSDEPDDVNQPKSQSQTDEEQDLGFNIFSEAPHPSIEPNGFRVYLEKFINEDDDEPFVDNDDLPIKKQFGVFDEDENDDYDDDSDDDSDDSQSRFKGFFKK